MKRHPALIPLSRDHHEVLLLAQLLKKDVPPYKNMPSDIEGISSYASNFFEHSMTNHFQQEEEIYFPAFLGLNHDIDNLIKDLLQEHEKIRHLFRKIDSADEAMLHDLGLLLESHVRKEERELFQQVQSVMDDKALSRLFLSF